MPARRNTILFLANIKTVIGVNILDKATVQVANEVSLCPEFQVLLTNLPIFVSVVLIQV